MGKGRVSQSEGCLNTQWQGKFALHGVELRLGCKVRVFAGVVMVGNISRKSLGVFNNTGDRGVDFSGHFVQEACYLRGISSLSLAVVG